MNAPWWLAKVSAAWKRKHGPPDRAAREARVAKARAESFGEVSAERDAELRQKLVDAHAGKGPLL